MGRDGILLEPMASDSGTGAERARRGWPRPVWLGLALGAGLLLRLLFVWKLSRVTGDSQVYATFARNVLQHDVYGFTVTANGITRVQPTLIRLPGYPLFLGICFVLFGMSNFTAVMVVQALVDLGTCLLIAALAGRLVGQQAFWPALWLAALCPFMANYCALPLTETLTLFTIALAFHGLCRWVTRVRAGCEGINRWIFVIAVALAYSILLRPEQGLLAAAVVPAMAWELWRKGGWRAALRPVVVVSLLTLAPLGPWAVRNWMVFHVFQPLAPKQANDPGESVPLGFQRWYRTWAIDFASTELTYWPYDGDPIFVGDLPARAFDSAAQQQQTAAVIARYDETDTPSPAVDKAFDAIARDRIRANPLRYYVELPVARLFNMLFRPRLDELEMPLAWWEFGKHPWATVGAALYALLNLGYFALAAWGLARRRWDWVVVGAMLGTLFLRSALLLTIDNSEPRYTLEFFPVLIVLAAGCFVARRETLRGR